MELVKNLLLLGMMECILKTNRRASSYRNSGYWDSYGKACHLLKEIVRKASSKLTEETPSPFMTDELRQKMGEAAAAIHNMKERER
jgi:biotin carboxylase